jgi:hypothetical protein
MIGVRPDDPANHRRGRRHLPHDGARPATDDRRVSGGPTLARDDILVDSAAQPV